MCKFESRTSPGYRLVVVALMRYSKEAPEVVSRRWKHAVDKVCLIQNARRKRMSCSRGTCRNLIEIEDVTFYVYNVTHLVPALL